MGWFYCEHFFLSPSSRLDSKTLLQRYNPIQGDSAGQWYHQSANLFSGYSSVNKSNYVSVAVKYITQSKVITTVQVIKKASGSKKMDAVVDP